MSVEDINSSNHPVKIGLSDAYYIDKIIGQSESVISYLKSDINRVYSIGFWSIMKVCYKGS